jgi:hypothetical protein
VLELDAGPRHVHTLEKFREALDQQQQAGEGDHAFERPQHRPPGRLVRQLVDLPGIDEFMPADHQECDKSGKEE